MNRAILIFAALFLLSLSIAGQPTLFNYQGSLQNGGPPANGNFDFEFALFTAVSGGSQLGTTQTVNGVSVANGTFSVALNFGDQFPGSNRFLEIRVRPAGGGAFTTLSPRQPVNSAPYSVKSLNAATATNATTATNALQLGGVAAGEYIVDGETTIAAGTQFNIGANRVLAISGFQNTFTGRGAGASNVNTFPGGGSNNAFYGHNAGNNNTTGSSNSFFGTTAGAANTTAGFNSFFGQAAGLQNTTGTQNAFFGSNAGESNQTGGQNSFFGYEAGNTSNTGNNSFFGFKAGRETTGINNSFFGWSSGLNTTTGTNNAFFGVQSGLNNQTGIRNVFVGRDAGRENTSGNENVYLGFNAGLTAKGSNNTAVGRGTVVDGNNNTAIGADAKVLDPFNPSISFATAIGAGVVADLANSVRIGRGIDDVTIDGSLEINNEQDDADALNVFGRIWLAGDLRVSESKIELTKLDTSSSNNHICYSGAGGGSDPYTLVKCAVSSIRFKKEVTAFKGGLNEIRKLVPVKFTWRFDNNPDFGLIAEEVAKVEPLLASYDKNGVVEGVHYDRIPVLLINAVKEQQAQIEKLQKQVELLVSENRTVKTKLKRLGANRRTTRNR